jgi:plastocyanin
VALAAVAVLMVTGCGGGGGGTPSPTAPSGGGSNQVMTINITGVHGATSFSPNPATIPAGQMAIFKNTDVVAHHVVLNDGSVDAGELAPGQSSQPLALGGVSKSYHCATHPSMVGSLNAAPTPEPPPCTGYCG